MRSLLVALLALELGCSSPARPATRPGDVVARLAKLGGPAVFAPAFGALDSVLTPPQRDLLAATLPREGWRYHMTTGLWLRNEFIRRDERLARFFYAVCVRHPDDMSSALLNAYGAYVRGERIDLPALVRALEQPPAPVPADSGH